MFGCICATTAPPQSGFFHPQGGVRLLLGEIAANATNLYASAYIITPCHSLGFEQDLTSWLRPSNLLGICSDWKPNWEPEAAPAETVKPLSMDNRKTNQVITAT